MGAVLEGGKQVITDEQAKKWAEYFIKVHNDFYEFSDLCEDEDFTGDYPYERDWEKVHSLMTTAKVEVRWGG